FAVGSRLEPVALRFQISLDLYIIFDNSIVNNGDPRLAIHERMRVFVHGSSVRRPSSVANPHRSREVVKIVFRVDLLQSSAVFLHSQSVIVDCYFAYRVVTSVLEPLERGMDYWCRIRALVKNAAEYSAQTPNTLRVDSAIVEGRALRITARPTLDS